jgi:hypothetical protein
MYSSSDSDMIPESIRFMFDVTATHRIDVEVRDRCAGRGHSRHAASPAESGMCVCVCVCVCVNMRMFVSLRDGRICKC